MSGSEKDVNNFTTPLSIVNYTTSLKNLQSDFALFTEMVLISVKL